MRKFPAIAPLCFLIAGILIADSFSLPSWAGLSFSVATIILALFALRFRIRLMPFFFLAVIAGFGATHFSARFIDRGPQHLSHFINPEQLSRIYGRVADWPDLKANRTEIVIDVDSLIGTYQHAVEGKLLLKISDTTTSLQRGDRVEFSGRLYPVPENKKTTGFNYGRFLRLKEINAIVYLPTLLNVRVDRVSNYSLFSWVDDLRSGLLHVFQKTLSPRESALSAGFLIGETRNIPPDIYRMFRDSGTLHLLAVSGSNVALVIVFFMVVLRPFRLGRKSQAIVLLGVIVVFVMLSYGDPSVVRAAVMASLVIVARLMGRKINLNHIVSLAAFVILMVNPTQLFDVGFQLSYLTAWGLVFMVPILVEPLRKWHGRLWYRWLVFPIIISIVAQVVSTPIIAVYFHRIPVISVLANLIIVPLVSLAVLAILAVLVAYLLLPVFGMFIGSVVNLLLAFIIRVLVTLGGEQLPVMSTSDLRLEDGGGWMILFFYVVITLLVLSIRHKIARRFSVFAVLFFISTGFITTIANARESNGANLFLRKIPGGIVALVYKNGSQKSDMLITGLSRHDYSFGEKVLEPMIAETRIPRVGSLFLLSADYASVKDILEYCQRNKVEWLYIPKQLRQVVEDIRARAGNRFKAVLTGYMDGANALENVSAKTGWLATPDSVLLTINGSSVLFANSVGKGNELPDKSQKRIVVLGRHWSPTQAEIIHLRQSGVELVVAGRISRFVGDSLNNPDIDSEDRFPEYMIDMTERRELHLILSSEGKIDFK